jgi:ABC-type multidrug transport system fused ATPase/permease subunit
MKRIFINFMAKYKCITFPLFGIMALVIFSSTLMLLWNWLIPDIFGLTTISFWQALGLFALSRLLFSGLGGGRRCGRFNKGKHLKRKEWLKMTQEERQKWFKKRDFNHKFSHYGRYSEMDCRNDTLNDE